MNHRKLLRKVLASPANIRFAELTTLAEGFGFKLGRINGSHHIYTHSSLPEIINLQNVVGKAKPYQVRQLLRLVERYNLQLPQADEES
jgi:predicted RNA binding protein YcfA (HicA-like mRNA interferase family)